MSLPLTEQTKAILLLTAPLIVGRSNRDGPKILTPTEYNKLATRLVEIEKKPTDLMSAHASELFQALEEIIDSDRLKQLLDRGLLMSQALDQWQSRGIWVVSRADPEYPNRLKAKLKKHAPPLIYGCGDSALLEQGGLGIVGSRKVDKAISQFVEVAAILAAHSGHSVVSGGAKGVDQIAMHAALQVEGTVVGALAENLSRAVVAPQYRDAIKRRSLVLMSAVDPNMGFTVGNAMARNKLIYALSDAGLVANADYEKGGTWAGAIEQINRFKCCPVYVRTTERTPKGNKALIERGAIAWPEPVNSEAFQLFMKDGAPVALPHETELTFDAAETKTEISEQEEVSTVSVKEAKDAVIPPAELIRKAAEQAILQTLKDNPLSDVDLAKALDITKPQLKAWLEGLLTNHLIEKTKRPVRYRVAVKQPELFDI
jgi:DNA processing protein